MLDDMTGSSQEVKKEEGFTLLLTEERISFEWGYFYILLNI